MREAVDIDASSDEVVTPTPRVTMAGLLARFDPANHRHDLVFDIEARGTETLLTARPIDRDFLVRL